MHCMTRTKLKSGEHTIDSVKPTKTSRGYRLCWRYRDDHGKAWNMVTVAPSIGEARARAKRTLEKRLDQAQSASEWTGSSNITQFIDRVVIPAIDEADIKPRTRDRYHEVLQHFRSRTLGREIKSLTTAAALKEVLRTISQEVGVESARQSRSVVSAYVVQQFIEHGIVSTNPIKGLKMPFTQTKPQVKPPTPTVDEWRDLLDFILHEEDAAAPMPGKTNPQAHKVSAKARHARVMQLTALQMTTGLRITEAITLVWPQVSFDQHDAWITITEDHSKTKKSRKIPVLHPEVSHWLHRQWGRSQYVIGLPTDADKPWDRAAATKAVRHYYTGLAELYPERFSFLAGHTSHIWRTVLTTALVGALPPHLLAAYFGHTPAMSQTSYTDHTNVKPVLTGAKSLLLESKDLSKDFDLSTEL